MKIQFKKEDDISIMEMATSAMEKNQFEEARTFFAKIVEHGDQSDEAWVGLARIHRVEFNNDLARACLLRGLDENPYNRTAITNLYEWVHEDGVDFNRTLFDRYLNKHPEDKDILKFNDRSS